MRRIKSFEDYKDEFSLLTDMFRCSSRYLHNSGKSDAIELERKMHILYNKYAERLEKKCRKNTGMSIYEDISGTNCGEQ